MLFRSESQNATGNGTRGIIFGGYSSWTGTKNNIEYVTIANTGNAADFGDLSVTRTRTAACSNATYSFRFGGSNSSVSTASLTLYNVADYFACATLGNASDFGDSTASHTDGSAHSDGTTGVVWHGMNGSAGNASSISNTIDKYTLNSASNATDFGDTTTTTNRWNITESGGGNGTRGVWMGGTAAVSPYSSTTNVIDYITVATPGNATDFGDLVTARYVGTVAGAGTDDRALYFGGYTGSAGTRQIDYITVSTTGNASDFGDLSSAISTPYSGSAAANATRAVYLAAYTNNVMEYVTMSTTGNAADFGDISSSNTKYYGGAAANATRALWHGSYSGVDIHYVTMSTLGNSSDFGDQLVASNTLQSHSSGNAS